MGGCFGCLKTTSQQIILFNKMLKNIFMPKLILLILGLILSFSLSANEKIRGHYKLVGNMPGSNSIKKVVFEEFINFGCSHCNKLHKASKDFRKKFADKIEFVDIPVSYTHLTLPTILIV